MYYDAQALNISEKIDDRVKDRLSWCVRFTPSKAARYEDDKRYYALVKISLMINQAFFWERQVAK